MKILPAAIGTFDGRIYFRDRATINCPFSLVLLHANGVNPDGNTAFAPQKPVAIRLYLLGGLYCTARLAARPGSVSDAGWPVFMPGPPSAEQLSSLTNLDNRKPVSYKMVILL